MEPSELSRAVSAAMSIASGLGLVANDAVVLQNSNSLALRLSPCEVMARVAPVGRNVAPFEVALAQSLAEMNSPAAALEPRVAARPYERDGFVVTLWTYYPFEGPVAPGDYADALKRLHTGMAKLEVAAPHFMDRVAEAEQIVARRDRSPGASDEDRAFLSDLLSSLRQVIAGWGAAEQLLHGEPHPGNVLGARGGPVFIDLETCCRGPVEFDLAHAPAEAARRYPGADPELLSLCRHLVLAMVTAWRWEADDQFPNRARVTQELLRTLREGPPWPTLEAIMDGLSRQSPEP